MTPHDKAIMLVKDLFKHMDPIPPVPTDMTIEELWVLYNDKISTTKHKSPGVEPTVRLLLEDPDLAEIPIPDIAEIIKEVFRAYGIKCKCSESSVRWYQSQKGLDWKVIRRIPPKKVTDVMLLD